VNGKLRGEVQWPASADDAEIRDMPRAIPGGGLAAGKTVKKVSWSQRCGNLVVA